MQHIRHSDLPGLIDNKGARRKEHFLQVYTSYLGENRSSVRCGMVLHLVCSVRVVEGLLLLWKCRRGLTGDGGELPSGISTSQLFSIALLHSYFCKSMEQTLLPSNSGLLSMM